MAPTWWPRIQPDARVAIGDDEAGRRRVRPTSGRVRLLSHPLPPSTGVAHLGARSPMRATTARLTTAGPVPWPAEGQGDDHSVQVMTDSELGANVTVQLPEVGGVERSTRKERRHEQH